MSEEKVLVPMAPTEEMIDAAKHCDLKDPDSVYTTLDRQRYADIYEAMVERSQKP